MTYNPEIGAEASMWGESVSHLTYDHLLRCREENVIILQF